MGVEMLPVMARLMVIFTEQATQHADRRLAVFGMRMWTIVFDQMAVAVGDIASAGIAHNRLRNNRL
jgi:hypothetical protein